MLAAETTEVLWTLVTFAFVLFVLGLVVYALVRPFTHRHHEPGSGIWMHLP